MSARRRKSAAIASLFDSASAPIYALGADRRIVFVNAACESWLGQDAESLLGVECRYHSEPDVDASAQAAACLCPPPEAFAGQAVSALIVSACGEGDARERRFDFVPLLDDDGEVAGVLAMGQSTSTEAVPSSDDGDLHALLVDYRRRLRQRYRASRLVGVSPAIRQALAQVDLAARVDANVLIMGPPGAGRQHAARTIHYAAADERAGITTLECKLLSPEALQSALRALSHEEKSQSKTGTLLLLDVDELSNESQIVLGAELPKIPARVIATARQPLSLLAEAGIFRVDLAHALSILVINIPPLAERMEDLPLLCQSLVEEINARGAKQISGVTPEALDLLARHSWPGNVEELARVIADAHMHAAGPAITARDLSQRMRLAADAAARPRKKEHTIVLDEFLAEVERELIERALRRARNNKAKAARLLGMTRPRLYRRLVQLGLAPPEPEMPVFIEAPPEDE